MYVYVYTYTHTHMGGKYSGLKKQSHKKVVMIGLDGAGKTTILYKLKMGEALPTIPTIGFNIEGIVHKSLNMAVWDVGGQFRVRQLWHHYFDDVYALIYVIDSVDYERFKESSEELHNILLYDKLVGVPVLIFSNKSDHPISRNADQMAEILDMKNVTGCQWHIQSTIGLTGQGLSEGLDWLHGILCKKKTKKTPTKN